MAADASSVYAQLLGVGLVWVWVHCSGMCGPLVVGLDVAGRAHGATLGRSTLGILGYQLGRAITYALLGALAGLAGAGLREVFVTGGGVVSVGIGAAVIVVGASRLWGRSESQANDLVELGRRSPTGLAAVWQRGLDVVRLKLLPLTAGPELGHRVLLGAVLGFLPCMITFWALGLAAVSGSVIDGAGVMLLLVVITTPTLWLASALPRILPRPPAWLSRFVPTGLLTLSGIILVLAGLAGMELIAHAHLSFEVGGRHYAIMFW